MKLTGYSHYRGQNLGRIMHCVATYCDGLRHHETTIDYGEIRFYGRLIARYKWPDETDTPHFEFYDEEGWRNAKLWEYNQFVRKPYLDDYPPNLDYVVQEARKVLRFDEALQIRWARDEYKDGWNGGMRMDVIKSKVEFLVRKYFFREPREDEWKHISLSAIYDI